MKNKIIIFLIIITLLITGCTNKQEELQKETTKKVTTTISDISNITEEKIKESYLYIKDNYNNYKEDKIYKKLLYHIEYLSSLGKYSKENKLTILATKTKTYLDNPNKKNTEALKIYLNNIDGSEDKIIKELYNNYITLNTVKKIKKEQKTIVNGDINDKTLINKEYINDAINYIYTHLENPYKNDETLQKTIYYSMFLSNLGNKTNKITIFSNLVLEYIETMDSEKQEKAISEINLINKNQEELINIYLNEIKSN